MRKHFRTKGTLNGQRIGLARRMFLLLSVVFIAAIANMAMGGGVSMRKRLMLIVQNL